MRHREESFEREEVFGGRLDRVDLLITMQSIACQVGDADVDVASAEAVVTVPG